MKASLQAEEAEREERKRLESQREAEWKKEEERLRLEEEQKVRQTTPILTSDTCHTSNLEDGPWTGFRSRPWFIWSLDSKHNLYKTTAEKQSQRWGFLCM